MEENLKKKYNKIQIAKDHLDVAIEAFYDNKPPPTVHLIASAAFAVLRDLPGCKKSDFIKNMADRIKPGCETEFYWHMNKHYNFFKHAKSDADSEIEFDETSTDYLLLQCCVLVTLVDKSVSDYVKSFINWSYLLHPKLFNFPEVMKRVIEEEVLASQVESLSRLEVKGLGKNLYLAELKLKNIANKIL